MDRQDRIDRAVIDLDGEPRNAMNRDYEKIFEPVLCVSKKGKYRWFHKGDDVANGKSGWTLICKLYKFMEARKRLENKPTDWPDGMNFLVQELSGWWHFLEHEPHLGSDSTGAYVETGKRVLHAGKGHVFGDWRQSLEPRPESKPDKETLNPEAQQAEAWLKVCETLGEVCPNWLDLDSRAEDCAVLAIEGLANRSLFANKKHHDHKEGEGVKWDGESGYGNDWMNRMKSSAIKPKWEPGVDLPPVGTRCRIKDAVTGWMEVEILAHCGAFAVYPYGEVPGYAGAKHFRPIQSHRDKVIEAAETECGGIVDAGAVIRHLYEIGMLVYPGEDQ